MRLVQFARRDGARGVGVLDASRMTDLFEAGYSSALEAGDVVEIAAEPLGRLRTAVRRGAPA